MKPFYPTYLYIKTHNITGLKYFGKTTKDPNQYRGSGKRWLAHLKKHGDDVSTVILGYYDNASECSSVALKFSIDNQIVESIEWANLMNENGLDGGNTGRTNYTPHTAETKQKMSESKKGQQPWNTGLTGVTPGNKNPKTTEQKEKISKALTGRTRSPEAIQKTADKLRGKKRPDVSRALRGKKKSAETINKMKLAQQDKGPLSEETKQKIRNARKLQVITQETKDKLKGKIVCVNKIGEVKKIDKDLFYSQPGQDEQREWVFRRSKEGLKRRG